MEVREQENAISVRDVTKVYRLYDKPVDRLKESVSFSHKNYHRDFYALSGLSFEVKKGETVGIIGTNGSGKSTILKIITGVLTPTTGQVDVNGKISALLELGAGFNMDYTGIENIYMNGTMMGYTRKEMDAKLQDILEFAEIGDFVHQPVKTYSSGMFVRLAFALAINVDPEILIVDEALSVGDVFFQSKCYRRMEEIRKKGTTILMVTHDMGSIIKYCDRVVLLHKGEFIAQGPAGRVVDMYKKILAGKLEDLKAELEAQRTAAVSEAAPSGENADAGRSGGLLSDFFGGMDVDSLVADQVAKKEFLSGDGAGSAPAAYKGLMRDQLTINADRTEYGDGRAEIFTYTIKDKKGTELTGTNTMFEGADIKPVKNGDEYVVEFTQKMTLQGGEYLLSMSCTGFEAGEHVVYHRLYDVTNLTVISNKNTVGIYDMESQVKAEKRNTDE